MRPRSTVSIAATVVVCGAVSTTSIAIFSITPLLPLIPRTGASFAFRAATRLRPSVVSSDCNARGGAWPRRTSSSATPPPRRIRSRLLSSSDVSGGWTTKHVHRTANLMFRRLGSVSSTQDEARSILSSRDEMSTSSTLLAVTAAEQHSGRGTHDRSWVGLRGNAFLTVCVPSDSIPVTLTLLPLKVGSIVAKRVAEILRLYSSPAIVTVKWPNDVLVNGDKISGVLIESGIDKAGEVWFLIGVGVNVAGAPKIEKEGKDRGRTATCLADLCPCLEDGDEGGEGDEEGSCRGVELSDTIATKIARDVFDWLYVANKGSSLGREAASRDVVEEWKGWADFGTELVMRDVPGNEPVMPLSVEIDGQLRVRGRDGRERLLIADYLL